MTSSTQRESNAQSFFSVVPAYILLFKDENGDWCVDTERTGLGRAVTCFLSPFDAVIEAAHYTRHGWPHQVMAASQFEEGLFREHDGHGLIADIHLGWPAIDGRILARPGGAFGRCCQVMHHWALDRSGFEVDEIMLAEYTRFRELAGLYAWQETARNIPNWTGLRRQVIAEQAMDSLELTHGDPKDCRQLALFDPEFQQWHFVPYAETT
ncbi:hypothetical protein [Paraburkholderia sartisoli]|uniref:Uncharacterized protein n=1 Tax=Paraburkholderia sartisoli TaxID=83784 RepID=A0A1H4FTY3_9BURK|nr:hypothetical protein [Paraburkholderia sartisoli]SEB00754.1 hypothetical protein SAMN05192564_10590 [Paraburkholderia sartisoli]